MAKKTTRAQLETKTARGRLKHRGKPYFVDLARGLAAGYRTSKRGAGKWVARYYEGGRDYSFETIGTADDDLPADGAVVLDFDQAQDIAREKWRTRQLVQKGVEDPRKPYTVRRACEAYYEYLEANDKDVERVRYVFEAHLLPKFGDRPLADVTTDEWDAWLKKLAKTPARVRSRKGAKPQFKQEDASDPEEIKEIRRRRRSRAKRIWNSARAAFNLAWKKQKVPGNDPWERATTPKDVGTGEPKRLDDDLAKRTRNAVRSSAIGGLVEAGFVDFVEAGFETGARLSELARLNVKDYDRAKGAVHFRCTTTKTGKERLCFLSETGCELFERLTLGHGPKDPMLPAPGGGRWNKTLVQYRLEKVCRAANLGDVTFLSLRHTYVNQRLEEDVKIYQVAENTGHSIAILEKHYKASSDKSRQDAFRSVTCPHPSCEFKNRREARFCGGCGKPLKAPKTGNIARLSAG